MVVATLLGTLKDVVGYIFTSDKWVNSFLLNIITFLEGMICIPGAAQKQLTEFINLLLANMFPKGSSQLPGVIGQHRCF